MKEYIPGLNHYFMEKAGFKLKLEARFTRTSVPKLLGAIHWSLDGSSNFTITMEIMNLLLQQIFVMEFQVKLGRNF